MKNSAVEQVKSAFWQCPLKFSCTSVRRFRAE
jgi:hypothetical protein